MRFTIEQPDIGTRLDVFLADRTDRTRSQWQKLIKAGAVTVNGNTVTPHYAVREGDDIAVTGQPVAAPQPAAAEQAHDIPAPLLPRIVAETADYLVIDKPAGLIAHGGASVTEPTLADWLVQHDPAIAGVGEDPLRPGIVHRLDKDASGLMVIAKTAQAFKWLKGQFKNRETLKEYLALVYGATSKDRDVIDFPIARSAQGFKMAALPNAEQAAGSKPGRDAITEFAVEQRFINYTFLRATIKTGRTHQIRVHFAAYGHPLVGDDLYGTRKTRAQNVKLGLDRIFLHATRLGFTDLDYQKVEFTSELPAALHALLEKVK